MAVELLSQADGYGIICGLSVLFCGIILVAVRIQKRYLSEDSEQSEMFMVANRVFLGLGDHREFKLPSSSTDAPLDGSWASLHAS